MTPTRLIGLSEEEALALCEHYNVIMRVVREDKTFYFGTCDFVLNRVNVSLVNGIVVSVTTG